MDQPQLLPAVVQIAPTGKPLTSPALSPLLMDVAANEGGAAVRKIARTPALLAEARGLEPAVEAALRPAGPDELMTILNREGIQYDLPVKDLGPGEWRAFWGSYLNTLGDMPAACVEEAFIMWNRNHEKPDGERAVRFYPRAPQLYALADECRNKLRMMRYRIQQAAKYLPPPPPKAMDKLTKDEMIARGWLNADGTPNLGKMTAKPNPQPGAARPAATLGQAADSIRRQAGIMPPMLDDEEAI